MIKAVLDDATAARLEDANIGLWMLRVALGFPARRRPSACVTGCRVAGVPCAQAVCDLRS
jgi:hypothetical protein